MVAPTVCGKVMVWTWARTFMRLIHPQPVGQGGAPRALQPALRPFVAAQLEARANDPAFGVLISPASGCAAGALRTHGCLHTS